MRRCSLDMSSPTMHFCSPYLTTDRDNLDAWEMKYKACFKLPRSVKPNYEVLQYKIYACLSCKFFMHSCAPHSLHLYACTWLALHSMWVYLHLACVRTFEHKQTNLIAFSEVTKAFSLKIFVDIVLALIQSFSSASPPHLPSILHLIHHRPLQIPHSCLSRRHIVFEKYAHYAQLWQGWMCQDMTGLCKQTGLYHLFSLPNLGFGGYQAMF